MTRLTLALAAMFSITCWGLWAQQPTASDTQTPQITTLVTIADARSGIVQRIDLGEPGDSPGDMFVFDQPLLNANHEPIGANSGFCIRTLPGKFSQCQWTLTLANGTITVAGREADSGTSIISIVGGSGDYLLVGGVMATTPNGDRTYSQVLTLYHLGPHKTWTRPAARIIGGCARARRCAERGALLAADARSRLSSASLCVRRM